MRFWRWEIRKTLCVLLSPEGEIFAAIKRKDPLALDLAEAYRPWWGELDTTQSISEGAAAWIVRWVESARISRAITSARR